MPSVLAVLVLAAAAFGAPAAAKLDRVYIEGAGGSFSIDVEIGDQRLADGGITTRECRLGRHLLANSPPDASRIGVWRTEMTAAEQDVFASVAGDLLREPGYEA